MLTPEREKEILEAIGKAFSPFLATGEIYDYRMRIRLRVYCPEPAVVSERLVEGLAHDRELKRWLRSLRRLLRERGYDMEPVVWEGS